MFDDIFPTTEAAHLAAAVCWWLGILLFVAVSSVIGVASHTFGVAPESRHTARAVFWISVFLIPFIIFVWSLLMTLIIVSWY